MVTVGALGWNPGAAVIVVCGWAAAVFCAACLYANAGVFVDFAVAVAFTTDWAFVPSVAIPIATARIRVFIINFLKVWR